MKRIIAGIVLMLSLAACTQTSYRFDPVDTPENPREVKCGTVRYVEDHFFDVDTDGLGLFCIQEIPE